MKTVLNLGMGFFMLIFAATCNQVASEHLEVTGTIEAQGITTYQYGSHTLSGEQGFYALTSQAVDLNRYVGRKITVKAEKVEGYPVDGGPEYLRVLEVRE